MHSNSVYLIKSVPLSLLVLSVGIVFLHSVLMHLQMC